MSDRTIPRPETYVDLMWSVRYYLLSDFKQNWNMQINGYKQSNDFVKIPYLSSRVITCGRTDRHEQAKRRIPTFREQRATTPLNYLHNQLTSWSWPLLEKPPVVQLLKNFASFYGTRRFITVFTRALHWSLSWARSIQYTAPHPISRRSILISSIHLRPGQGAGTASRYSD
jgi:hypothetical protein